MAGLELYGTAECPYTSELREHLRWRRTTFTEYDVDRDSEARARLEALMPGKVAVPVLVEDGCIREIGWRGRSCMV